MGQHPTVVYMRESMKARLEDELKAHEAYRAEGYAGAEIFGMRIEVRDDLDNGVLFIIS